jgi:Skp family chaperone for outer membrane proteins
MTNSINTDDVIFNFFKQICDEKDDKKCIELGNNWINAMEKNLENMEVNLDDEDKAKHKNDIQKNRDHLNSLKNKNSSEWREYATKCMIEIIENKKQI